ncbi:MAG TPA: hypothetical protein VIL88_12615, partial [Devosia sp.]|uniref:hypothetical protein n=1 Tax=Devosia sp. TaxID=1871048 RepID=UPI002F95E310
HRKSLTSTGIASSFSSQEPRRPRFSFFYLHNVKELTKSPSPVNLVVENQSPQNFTREQKHTAGHPAPHSSLSETANSGRNKFSASLALAEI